jgi:hypothetical protein
MDPTNTTSNLYYEMRGAYTDLLPETYARLGESEAALANYGYGSGSSYGDLGGGDIYNGVYNVGAYDFGTDADYGTGYGSSSSSNSNYFDNTSGVQVAGINPAFSGYGGINTMSDTNQGPDLFAQTTTGPVQPITQLNNESGATSNIGVTPLADGSAVISRPDGSSITLDNEQFSKLLSGDNSVLGATSNQDKPTERFGATTNIAKEELTLPSDSRQGQSTITNLTQPPVEDRVGTPVTKAPVDYELSSYMGKGAPVQDYRIDPITGGLTKTTATQTQGLQPNRGGSSATFESNYILNPERIDGYVRGSGQIDADRVPRNADVYAKDSIIRDEINGDYVDPNRPLGTGALPTGKTIDESLLPPDLRKYSTLDPNTQYGIGPDGKPISAYMNRDELANKTVVPESLQKYTSSPSTQSSGSGSGKGGGGGGGGGSAPPKPQQQQKKSSGMNPALLAMLAALLAKSGGDGGKGGTPANSYDLQRAQAELEKDRRAGSSAQSYYTGPGTVKKAAGGITSLQNPLGGYSDGGRLLRGPGDGVSDSIPATIGKKQPARLADGEFVVPARIVSELGNGSTEAGARKLYAMMDRVQKARKNTVGKGKVAHNSRADKYLPK